MLSTRGRRLKESDELPFKNETVPALRRAVRALDLIATSSHRMNSADLTRALELPKSTAHGLLAVMMELGLIVKSRDGGLIIGSHPLRWASDHISNLDLVATFKEIVSQHRDLDGFTVNLTVRDSIDVICVACRNSLQPLDQSFRLGARLPVLFSACGKMLLTDLSMNELQSLFSPFPPPLTPKSIKTLPELHAELDLARLQAFVIDDGQVREGLVGVAASVRDHTGRVCASASISIIRTETDSDKVVQLGGILRDMADDLSIKLGHRNP